MNFKCGGKVFILGEYACLVGKPALVTEIEPDFELNILKKQIPSQPILPFHQHSPAGVYLKLNGLTETLLREYAFEFKDPYESPIGVGSSSAQFILMVEAVCSILKKPFPSPQEILQLYWDVCSINEGMRPSGLDLLCQYVGGTILATNDPYSLEKLEDWKANDSFFVLAYTGSKIKTHEHLKELEKKGFPDQYGKLIENLNYLTLEGFETWKKPNSTRFGFLMNSYQEELTKAGITPKPMIDKIESLRNLDGVYGVKGSGSQGGDCVLLLVNQEYLDTIQTHLEKMSWKIARTFMNNVTFH